MPITSAIPSTPAADALIARHLNSLCWLHVGHGGQIIHCSDALRRLIGAQDQDLSTTTFPKLFCAQEESGELPHAQSILTANQSELRTWAHWKHKSGNLVPVGLYYKRLEEAPATLSREAFCVPMLVVVFERERQGEMEQMIGALQARLEEALNQRQQLVLMLGKQMGGALASVMLTVNALKLAAARIPGGVGAMEVKQIEENISTCQRVLDNVLAGNFTTYAKPK